jgi:hypothetical protein
MINLVHHTNSCLLLMEQTTSLKVIFNSDISIQILYLTYLLSLSFYPQIYMAPVFQIYLQTQAS